MQIIRGTQIKAARALLDWSQDDLAQRTGLAVTTVRKSEDGFVPRGKTTEIICNAFLDAGLEFIEPEGVCKCRETIQRYEGTNSAGQFLDDIIQTVKAEACAVYSITFSRSVLQCLCDVTRGGEYERFKCLNEMTTVKCLFSAEKNKEIQIPFVESRTLPLIFVGSSQFFVYGNKRAFVMPQGNNLYQFAVFKMPSFAHEGRQHFLNLWNNAELLMSTRVL